MSKRPLVWLAVALVCLGSGPAFADQLNLWISYHFQGIESYEAGKYRDAENLLNEARDETDADHRLAFTLDGLGMTHAALGQYSEAEDCFERALCLRKRACGPESRFVPATLNSLADLHYIAGDKGKIECLYRRALAITEKDPYSVEVARSLNGLALVANDAGDGVEAENLLKRAVRIHMKGGRSEHPYMATVLINLGALYTNQCRYDEAWAVLRRAQFIQEETLGEDHPDVAIRLHALAGLLAKTGKLEEARAAQDRANAIQACFAQRNAATNS